jgi:hypothetical protein
MVVVGGLSSSSDNLSDAFSFHFGPSSPRQFQLGNQLTQDTGKREWRKLAVPASFSARHGHQATAMVEVVGCRDGGLMLVHGGLGKAGPLADLHLFRFGALIITARV